jgi:hypothetical protein
VKVDGDNDNPQIWGLTQCDQAADASIIEYNGNSYLFYSHDDNTNLQGALGYSMFHGTLAQYDNGEIPTYTFTPTTTPIVTQTITETVTQTITETITETVTPTIIQTPTFTFYATPIPRPGPLNRIIGFRVIIPGNPPLLVFKFTDNAEFDNWYLWFERYGSDIFNGTQVMPLYVY